MVYHRVVDDDYAKGGVVGGEGHHAAELPLVHHVHVRPKKSDFGYTVKCGFKEQENLADYCQ